MMKKHRKLRKGLHAAAVIFLLCSFLMSPGMASAENSAMYLEAEDGTAQGHVRVVSSGERSWVEGFQEAGDQVELTIQIDESGMYDIAVLLASADGGHKENPLLVDGQRAAGCGVEGKEFQKVLLSYIYLTKGEHTLGLGTSWGWVRVDAFEITPSSPLPEDLYQVSPVLVNPDPSPEAQRLFAWMCDIYGKKIITGQNCDGGMYGLENQAVWRATGGLYPALLGLDMMEYSPSRVERGSQGKSVDQAIQYWEEGGIVTFCWHWNAPTPYLKGDRWYSGFYTEYSSINLKKIMDGGDPKGYELLLKDLDAIAFQLGRLRDAGVPVLWRPLHEASGGWFWWGASGPDAYKWLWNLMYQKFTEEYHLNNLIWVWNGQHADWYPGDDTVDMIGEDIYPGERVYSSQSAKFMECLKYTDTRKMIILSENGCVPDPELLFRDGTVWGSYCTWGGNFVLKSSKFNKPSEQYTEVWLLKKMYEDERSVTRADLPDLRSGNAE
ncbi:MAG: beta-mannosidase [Clostridia bacterium]|nr:beta-mannosidase [Clostridia bacterium]